MLPWEQGVAGHTCLPYLAGKGLREEAAARGEVEVRKRGRADVRTDRNLHHFDKCICILLNIKS